MTDNEHQFLRRADLQTLIDSLLARGYRCIGPQIRDDAIVYDNLASASQLPHGVTQHQSPANYKLIKNTAEGTAKQRCFSWANGPQAIKPFVFAPSENLWRSFRDNDHETVYEDLTPNSELIAIIGVRACDIAGLFIQDKHFLQENNRDPYYASRRQTLFLVAVNCSHPAQTCFCASTGDGPGANYGYDIVLSELDDGYVIHARSVAGLAVLNELPVIEASPAQINQANSEVDSAARQQTRRLPDANIPDVLVSNSQHSRWDEVAGRCLACGNCTSVCPTCFCHAEFEESDLNGKSSLHNREWDSCFTQHHSYIHGITIRATTAQRYRQWLTHKFATWYDQYGRSGCVGCGRCISWCPAAIDVTEELSVICSGGDDA